MDLSILIPARNEIFLARTIQDILEHSEANTEIVAVLDGEWANPPIPQHERVTVLHFPESIGQRAATNRAAEVAQGEYFMKVDAHCAFDLGFDRILLESMRPSWTMVPVMRNLHAFDWVCCDCGSRRYQGPSGPCQQCGGRTEMDIVWIAKQSPQSTAYRFDRDLHFQFCNEFKKRPEGQGHLTDSLSLQGSCFMLHRDRYFELNICDESWGSWGNQGTEVALKTWLSGGRVVVNHHTWYAHLFRTQGGDFGFPYPLSGREVENARQRSRDLFLNDAWDKAIHPLSWLIGRFAPVPDWDANLTKGIVYYTDNQLDPDIMQACRAQLCQAAGDISIVAVSLAPIGFDRNIVIEAERGYLTMFRQILAGLEALDTDVVFFCEHDVLYHASHFDFVPPRQDTFYYNTNVWKLRYEDGHALHYDVQQTSGLCADRALLIKHYQTRVARTEAQLAELGDGRRFRNWIRRQGFEPGTHGRAERVDDFKAASWQSDFPNVDIRHDGNLTPNRWRKDQFRNQRYTQGWTEADEIPGWGKGVEILNG